MLKPGGDANLLSGILAAYAGRPDARQVDILFGGATDRADHVRDGRADVALLYVPFGDMTGLDHEILMVEGRVAILPRSPAQPMRPGLVHRPVIDAPNSEIVLAWSQDDRRSLVASFVAAAVDAAGASRDSG